jgi:chromosome segregation ATPase
MPEEQVAELTAAQAELIRSGFRPQRHSGPVRLVRRLLWPFMRPFHFHMLNHVQALAAAQTEVRSRTEQISHHELPGLEARLGALLETRNTYLLQQLNGELARIEHLISLQAELRAEVAALRAEVAALRAEVVALSNRHVCLEDAVDEVETRTRAICGQIEKRLDTLQRKLTEQVEGDHQS